MLPLPAGLGLVLRSLVRYGEAHLEQLEGRVRQSSGLRWNGKLGRAVSN